MDEPHPKDLSHRVSATDAPLRAQSPIYPLRALTQGVSLDPWTQPAIALGQANVLPKPGFSEVSAACVPNPKQL